MSLLRPPRRDGRAKRFVRHAVVAAFAILVGTHLLVLASLAIDGGWDVALLVLLAGATLFGVCAVALAWGGLVLGHGAALIGALVVVALYSAATLVMVSFPDSDSTMPNDDPLPRTAFYLAVLWVVTLVGVAARATRAREPG